MAGLHGHAASINSGRHSDQQPMLSLSVHHPDVSVAIPRDFDADNPSTEGVRRHRKQLSPSSHGLTQSLLPRSTSGTGANGGRGSSDSDSLSASHSFSAHYAHSTPVLSTTSPSIRLRRRPSSDSAATGSSGGLADSENDRTPRQHGPRYNFTVPVSSPRVLNHRIRRHSLSLSLTAAQSPHKAATGISGDPAVVASATSFWPGTHELRRVFRCFDRDGDGLISVTELRLGLASLGFDVSRTTSLPRLSNELHADINGMIKESSFVKAFRKLNREKIVEELKAEQGIEEIDYKEMKITLCDIQEEARSPAANDANRSSTSTSNSTITGTNANRDYSDSDAIIDESDGDEDKGDTSTPGSTGATRTNKDANSESEEIVLPRLRYLEYSFPPSQLAAYLLPSTPTTSPRRAHSTASTSSNNDSVTRKVRWLDVVGVHGPTLSFLSNHFSLPPSCFDPALLSFDSNPHFDYDHDSIHDTSIMSVLMHAMSLNDNDGDVRHSKGYYHRRAAVRSRSLCSLPVHVIVIGDHTLITIHPLTARTHTDTSTDSSSGSGSDIFAEFRGLLSASVNHMLPLSSLSPFTGTLHTLTAQSLAIELLDELTDWNWSMRDSLHQWKNELEVRLTRGKVSAGMLDEIHEIQAIALQSQRSMQRINTMLEEVCKEEEDFVNSKETQANSSQSAAPSNPPVQHQSQPQPRLLPRSLSTTRFSLPSSQSPTAVASLKQSRHAFLADTYHDFQSLASNNSRLFHDLKLLHELIAPMTGYYRQRRDEETNSILYLLTILTALVTPLQLSSGIYGMNFKHFPEIDYQWSYAIFWGGNLAVMFAIAVFFKRKGWL